ncbi:hypothetical protein NHX12_026500 [Muraenolepis orangiensis]|uniref:Uncharacterized protein n=1 Tax=Muraenolepis orangiensis TaxID=630683 RepID=A0A9Q0IQV0_9TELE|nr:hypothetical protein NHX12_026500 [Muraenolepis orangiensis]
MLLGVAPCGSGRNGPFSVFTKRVNTPNRPGRRLDPHNPLLPGPKPTRIGILGRISSGDSNRAADGPSCLSRSSVGKEGKEGRACAK